MNAVLSAGARRGLRAKHRSEQVSVRAGGAVAVHLFFNERTGHFHVLMPHRYYPCALCGVTTRCLVRGRELCYHCRAFGRSSTMMTEFARHKLRPTAARQRKRTMAEASEQCERRCQELTNIPGHALFVLMHVDLKPVDVHHVVVANDMWFDEKAADRVMARYRHRADAGVYEHALACRIIDTWNMVRHRERWGTGICHYVEHVTPMCPTDPSLVSRPAGVLHEIARMALKNA